MSRSCLEASTGVIDGSRRRNSGGGLLPRSGGLDGAQGLARDPGAQAVIHDLGLLVGFVVWLGICFVAGSFLRSVYGALTKHVPRLRLHLREAVSYRLHLLLIVVLSRLLKMEVAREVRKQDYRRGR